MSATTQSSQAAAAYDVLAPYYDHFTAGYAYERWIDALERRALRLGLRGRSTVQLTDPFTTPGIPWWHAPDLNVLTLRR